MSDASGFSAEPAGAPRRGTSTGAKIMLGCVIGLGLCLVACCGLFGAVGYFGARFAQQSFISDPEQVREITAGLARLEIPEGFEPQGGVDAQVPIFGSLMKVVIYHRSQPDGILALARFDPRFTQGANEAIERQFREIVAQQSNRPSPDVGGEVEIREFTVRGAPATFEIRRAPAHGAQGEQVEVLGSFPGDDGNPVFLLLNVDAASFDEAQLDRLIESIQ